MPKEKLERANQLSQLMTYGTAPLAAVLLAVLGYIATGLGHVSPVFHTNKVDLALYFNGASYFVSAITVYILRQIGKREHSGVDLGARRSPRRSGRAGASSGTRRSCAAW